MNDLNNAQALVLAAHFAVEPDLPKLQLLAYKYPSLLTPEFLLRLLLTYLPAEPSIEQNLVHFLQSLENSFNNVSDLDDNPRDSEIAEILKGDLESKLESLHLDRIPHRYKFSEPQSLTQFLIEWVHRMERVSGITQTTLNLVDAFTPTQPNLAAWKDAYLLPLYRLQNQFYPQTAQDLSLEELEAIHGTPGVATLLKFAEQNGVDAEIGRDLGEVITPWVQGSRCFKRRKLDTSSDKASTSWRDVNEWILVTSQRQYGLAAKATLQWDGPSTMQDGTSQEVASAIENDHAEYVQTALAVAYISDETNNSNLNTKWEILERSSSLAQLMPPDLQARLPTIPETPLILQANKADLLDNALLRAGNPLTTPSTDALEFLHGVLATQNLLSRFKISTSTIQIASVTLFESEEKQQQELRAILNQIPRLTTTNIDWRDSRNQILWLKSWQDPAQNHVDQSSRKAFLGRISSNFLEIEILNSILTTGDYKAVQSIYLDATNVPLQLETIRESVVSAVFSAYDNASNGNKNRGGVKRASDILRAFKPSFPGDPAFLNIERLIAATHSLSFYQLTLQHGVPFQPVNIRVHRDPLSLIVKVLEQNSKAYTKLDDLLEIGRNLVLADLPTPESDTSSLGERASIQRRLFDAEHRITYQAITAALSDHDFDTAYSYITTRLSSSPSQSQSTPFTDDTSWRAAFAAGKYRPNSSPPSLHTRISGLSKRIDLLSLALTLAPTPEPLSEILDIWRRCEEEMDTLKAQALAEERAFESHGDASTLPGGFGPDDRDLDAAETRHLHEKRAIGAGNGPSYEEEAPIGLFDVARGAASAIRKSAFPLRNASGQAFTVQNTGQSRASVDSHRASGDYDRPDSADGDGQQRTRKRDMISNAVTGGFVSGMSWVLGAQPVNKEQHE